MNKLHFRCTVHTNTTPTVITQSCVLQKPLSCNDNGYKFEFKICRPNQYVSKILAKKSDLAVLAREMKRGMITEYLMCRADLNFEVDFGVNGAINWYDCDQVGSY